MLGFCKKILSEAAEASLCIHKTFFFFFWKLQNSMCTLLRAKAKYGIVSVILSKGHNLLLPLCFPVHHVSLEMFFFKRKNLLLMGRLFHSRLSVDIDMEWQNIFWQGYLPCKWICFHLTSGSCYSCTHCKYNCFQM